MINVCWLGLGIVIGFVFFRSYHAYRRDKYRSTVLARGWPALIDPIMDWKIKPCHPTEVVDQVAKLELPAMMEKAVAGAIMSRFRQEGKASVAEAVTRMYMELEGLR